MESSQRLQIVKARAQSMARENAELELRNKGLQDDFNAAIANDKLEEGDADKKVKEEQSKLVVSGHQENSSFDGSVPELRLSKKFSMPQRSVSRALRTTLPRSGDNSASTLRARTQTSPDSQLGENLKSRTDYSVLFSGDGVDSLASMKAFSQSGNNQKPMVSLEAGDLVWLRLKDDIQYGTLLGDCSLKSVGVELEDMASEEYVAPLRMSDGVFRLCSRLNYRSKVKLSSILKAVRHSHNKEVTIKELNLDLAKKRMESEVVQNAELLERLTHISQADPKERIRYGDIVQLQHVSSGKFLATHKTTAPQNPTCRRVSLKKGSMSAHFKILPKFKVRSIGSHVYADDEIMLQSVKYEPLFLGASMPISDLRSTTDTSEDGEDIGHDEVDDEGSDDEHQQLGAEPYPRLHMQVPTVLKHQATAEVNASTEFRSFKIKLYRRNNNSGTLLTSQHWFRLFHPEANAFIQASANPDKGTVLDALGTDDDPLGYTREGGVPAHLPYLKALASTVDASNPIHLSAKAVWCFEPLDRTFSVEVKWRRMPLRIRHVPSGKYLSVDSSRPTNFTPMSTFDGTGSSFDGEGSAATFFDAALVEDADPSIEEGAFGSPSSLVFYVMPTDAPSSKMLLLGTSAVRIEHRTDAGQVLHFMSAKEQKPQMLGYTGGSEKGVPKGGPKSSFDEGDDALGGDSTLAGSGYTFDKSAVVDDNAWGEGSTLAGSGKAVEQKRRGGRLCFTSEFSALHVLKIQPLGNTYAFKLNKLLSYIPLFKKYNYAFHAATEPPPNGTGHVPVHLCEAMAAQCLDIIDDVRKRMPLARRHGKNTAEALEEANTMNSSSFALLFHGETDPRMQKSAFEVKLLDAVFETVLSPYNRARQQFCDEIPFRNFPEENDLKGVQKFMFVTMQRLMANSTMAETYFSFRRARTWGKTMGQDACNYDAVEQMFHKEDDGSSLMVRRWELWRNITMAQGGESMGAMVTLMQLLRSKAEIVNLLVTPWSMKRFQGLMLECGPEARLINLFTSACNVEKKPSRTNQERVLGQLWLSAEDRFAYGVSFEEMDLPESDIPKLSGIRLPDGSFSQSPRVRLPNGSAGYNYLGKEGGDRYKQVCVGWTGTDQWKGRCGYLWFSPASMNVGPVVETKQVEGVKHPLQFVPIEQLMWVLEPDRLSKSVTGKAWKPFQEREKAVKGSSRDVKKNIIGMSGSEVLRKKCFDNQVELAGSVIAHMLLLTQMCKGRSMNIIAHLEKTYTYSMLVNISTNPHLPYKLVAASMDLTRELFINRFPQQKNCGAPCLPEKLWVLSGSASIRGGGGSMIQKAKESKLTFPSFALSSMSSAFAHPDPVLSHPDHFKFEMFSRHCQHIIKTFSRAGRVIHSKKDRSELGMASIRGQQYMLRFGFLSTFANVVDICVSNIALLDGRSDLQAPLRVFNPPTARYRDVGGVTGMKRARIETFLTISELRTNFQVGELLGKFKEKISSEKKILKQGSYLGGNFKTYTAEDYLTQSTTAASLAVFEDFENLFPGGSGSGTRLDFTVLSNKPDFDQTFIDLLMYDDDNLMAEALRLFDAHYGQRVRVMEALKDITLLEDARIPVYGDIMTLRADLSELEHLLSSASSWGVQSRQSGPWGDEKFNMIMGIIDKLLTFMHTRHDQAQVSAEAQSGESNYQGHFSDTDLQGTAYVCTGLWSLDVAKKWGPVLAEHSKTVEARHQGILHSYELQTILLEAVVMDPALARKGSMCTDREKDESERRLTMVKGALLVCSTAFAADNRKNQDILMRRFENLQDLASPPKFTLVRKQHTNSSGSDGGELAPMPENGKSLEQGAANDLNSEHKWPSTISEFAQSLMITILRGNASLCERLSNDDLVLLFCNIANSVSDVSTAPVLDMFIVLCKPERVALRFFQNMVCPYFTASELSGGYDSLHNSFHGCLEACAVKAGIVAETSDVDNGSSDGPDAQSKFQLTSRMSTRNPMATEYLSTDAASSKKILQNPERLARLARVLCEAGNESAATLLMHKCGMTIDAVCDAIVRHLACSREAAVRGGSALAFDPHQTESSQAQLSPTVLQIMTIPDGVGKSLLGLLVELAFAVPLNQEQIMSPSLWQFLESCAVPLMEGIGESEQMEDNALEVCADMVDLLEHLLIAIQRFGMYKTVTDLLLRERIVNMIGQDSESLLAKKQTTREFFERAFKDHCVENDVMSLNSEQFIEYLKKISPSDNAPNDAVNSMRATAFNEAFIAADADSDGLASIIEFSQWCGDVFDGLKEVPIELSDIFNNKGHRLSLHTIECAERLVMICRGKGHELGGALPRFSRHSKHARIPKKKKETIQTSARQLKTTGWRSALSVRRMSLVKKKSATVESLEGIEEQFRKFYVGLKNNTSVQQSLQKWRFNMVSTLERGAPGPPAKGGRSLKLAERSGDSGPTPTLNYSSKRWMTRSKKVTPISEEFVEAEDMQTAVPPLLTAEKKKRFSMAAASKEAYKEATKEISVRKTISLGRVKSGHFRAERAERLEEDLKDELLIATTIKIQLLFRMKMAQNELERRHGELKDNTMSGAVELSWENVTDRFVRYVTDKFWYAGNETRTCALIFDTWNTHLLKARTWGLDEDGRELAHEDLHKATAMTHCLPSDLNKFELSAFHGKQNELDRMGVTELLATVISSLSTDLAVGGLPDMAIVLFNELLNGGNESVQSTLYAQQVKVDTEGNSLEGKLIEHIAKRLERAQKAFLAKSLGSLGSGQVGDDENDGRNDAANCEHATCTVRFLQLLCAGHFASFQNYMRSQPNNHGGDVNLVKVMCSLVVLLCESTFAVSRLSRAKLDLVAQLLNTLMTCMLGPCAGNQEVIAASDLVVALNLIVHAVNDRDLQLIKRNQGYMELRGLSCLLLAACLEGREDNTTHELLGRRLDTEIIQNYCSELEGSIWVIVAEAQAEERLPQPDEVERIKVMQQFLAAVITVLTELEQSQSAHNDNGGSSNSNGANLVGAGMDKTGGGVGGGDGSLDAAHERGIEQFKQSGSKRKALVGTVEIEWRGKVERSCFPLPFEIKYLSDQTKEAFLDQVDLSSSEKRMKALVTKTEMFVREMELIYYKAEQSKVYRVLHKHLPTVKLANYAVVFALNLNLLVTPHILGKAPAGALYDVLTGSLSLSLNARLSLFLTCVLNLITTVGYGVVLVNVAETEVPLLSQEYDAAIREETAEAAARMSVEDVGSSSSSSSKQSKSLTAAAAGGGAVGGVGGAGSVMLGGAGARESVSAMMTARSDGRNLPLLADEGGIPVERDLKAWSPLLQGVMLSVLFSMLHAFNASVDYVLYACVVVGVSIPMVLMGFRDLIGNRPANLRERLYAIVYDSTIRRSFLRYNIVFATCCFLGFFVNSEWFTLELLDVLIISPVLADIIKSITNRGTALGLVFYLFCCSCLIFAAFGIRYFHNALQAPTYDVKTGEEGFERCDTTLSCFELIFYHGLNERGNVKREFVRADPHDNYLARIIYDTSIFVWMGIVVMNIITGLTVDSFSSIREKKQSRADILKNDCFVCGTLRNTYENYALSNTAPSFDAHVAEDHHLWTYAFYIAYLKKRDPTEDSGIESYVRSQLENDSLEWIPTRTGFVLEAEGKTGRESNAAAGKQVEEAHSHVRISGLVSSKALFKK